MPAIVIASDDLKFSQRLSVRLERAGLSTELSINGFERDLHLFRAADLIFIDGDFQNTTGLRLLERIRRSGIDSPVIFASGAWRDTASFNYLVHDLKAVAVLQKPVQMDVLLYKILSVLRKFDETSTAALIEHPRVLVVDDDRFFLRRVELLLASEGMQVTSFTDTQCLLDVLQNIEFDLVILDIDLPGHNGYDICRYIRKINELHSVPVLACSSTNATIVGEAMLSIGADSFLSKPFVDEEFFAQIRQLLATKRTIRSISA